MILVTVFVISIALCQVTLQLTYGCDGRGYGYWYACVGVSVWVSSIQFIQLVANNSGLYKSYNKVCKNRLIDRHEEI